MTQEQMDRIRSSVTVALLEWGGIGVNVTEQQLADLIADLGVKSEMAVIINANTVIRAPEALYRWA